VRLGHDIGSWSDDDFSPITEERCLAPELIKSATPLQGKPAVPSEQSKARVTARHSACTPAPITSTSPVRSPSPQNGRRRRRRVQRAEYRPPQNSAASSSPPVSSSHVSNDASAKRTSNWPGSKRRPSRSKGRRSRTTQKRWPQSA